MTTRMAIAKLKPCTSDEQGRAVKDQIFLMKGVLAASFHGTTGEIRIQHNNDLQAELSMADTVARNPNVARVELNHKP